MKRAHILFLVLMAALSISCILTVVDDQYPEGSWYPRNEFRKTMALKPGGTLSLENTNGDIKIQGWNEEKLEITAIEKRSYPLSPRISFYRSQALEPKIDVQSSEDAVRIRTSSAGDKEDELRLVHYDLRVPRSVKLDGIHNGQGSIQISDIFGSLQVSQKDGDVTVKNFSGFADIVLGSGSVEAELLDVRPEDEVRIKTGRGDIVLYLEAGIEAQIDADAPDGGISSDIDLRRPLPAKTVSVRLGEGKAVIMLSTLHGAIKIKKIEN
jgi:DUF4097 and DUF4098 domain-containing protein YvlB